MPALTRLANLFVARARSVTTSISDWFLAPADPRAYAALRIGYAVAALAVLVDLWPERLTLLSESGLFGGADAATARTLNLFVFAHSDAAVSAVLGITAVAIVCLGLGVVPRLAALVTYGWILSFSETARTALTGFDTILRDVGFALVISPMPRTWSVRARALRGEEHPPAYGLRLVQWQLMLIYVTTVWLKAPDPFWRNGEAVSYFTMSMFARAPTDALAHRPWIGGVLTYGTLLIEASLPFLLWMRKTRWLAVSLGLCLHAGIALTSRLALFSLTILPLYFAFFDTTDFARLESLRRAHGK